MHNIFVIERNDGLFYSDPIEVWDEESKSCEFWFDDRLKVFGSYNQAQDFITHCLDDEDAFNCHVVELTDKISC